MWHEARKQEKIVRKVIVDYRRRAERRHDYYDKIKQDPTKFMQIHGKRMKFHIDESGTLSDTDLHMVPWQGDKSNMIDRFDVRAHLDLIKEVKPSFTTVPIDKEEKKMNFERYRILVYNKHKGISEDQHLQKIIINEKYPEISIQKQEAEAKKQLLQSSKAMIGFDYSGGDGDNHAIKEAEQEEDESDVSSDEDEFLSELEDIPPLRELNSAALQDLERFSLDFGMGYTDFVQAMDNDQNIQERVDEAKAIESEKLKMAGKKSRRERRVLRDKRLKDRVIGPLSYIRKDNTDNESGSASESSCSEEDHDKSKEGEIEFITSFGESNDTSVPGPPGTTRLPSVTVKKDTKKSSRRTRSRSRSRRSRSRSRDRSRRSRSRSRGYYRSRRDSNSRRSRDHRGRSSSRDRSYRNRSRSRSRGRRSRSRDRRHDRRSRSRDRRSRSRGRRSRDKSPAKVATATLKLATPARSGLTAAAIKKMTPQEKLKIKMQRALKKQLKADQIAMADKKAQMFTDQMEREDELREMARKLRRKEDDKFERGSPYRRHSEYR